jgi:phosphoribosyl-AMP cyclohydrolase
MIRLMPDWVYGAKPKEQSLTRSVPMAKMDAKQLEEGRELCLDFDKLQKIAETGQPVVPVVVQNADSGEVLILAYANRQALEHALREGVATFWSTSRNQLWVKGATSGDTLELVEVRVNCEQNSLLYRVRPMGEGACHTQGTDDRARSSCYYRRIVDGQLEFV